jgi:hypothetical protein
MSSSHPHGSAALRNQSAIFDHIVRQGRPEPARPLGGMCARLGHQAVTHNHAGRLANCEDRRGRRLHPLTDTGRDIVDRSCTHTYPPLWAATYQRGSAFDRRVTR